MEICRNNNQTLSSLDCIEPLTGLISCKAKKTYREGETYQVFNHLH
ncbi:hypothetical protein A33Q_2557 [Indibacter alkaliphilus LW1]|uniref:Uncharacterized protein n=1 Tax=Indibacter alkaliphilus (strain CCUG 57479 / KCTC 22604 / LW1) TaxID=1189612 RepID=S2DAM4_INDAL|nr:hypothetical protein A33Q_2557 [Indibacter alkaliphilus LW1]